MNLFHKSSSLSHKLTANYPNKEVCDEITKWFYAQGLVAGYEIAGYEEMLDGELLSDVYGPSELIALENYLSERFDETITLPKGLIFTKQ